LLKFSNSILLMENTTNSEQFLNYYNLIDAFLKKEQGLDSTTPYSQKVKDAKNGVVKKYKDELLSLGELRNAIVHTAKINGEVIAEPHSKTVARIQELYDLISKPMKVIPKFQFKVIGARTDEFINNILLKMKENSFSQFPVFDTEGNICEIISTNTISRWLSSQLEENGTIIIDKVKVEDLLSEIEYENNYKFIKRSASVYEAYDMFVDNLNLGRNLDAIFITESGRSSEKLLGLITIADIANKI